jgi:hypothetical protein
MINSGMKYLMTHHRENKKKYAYATISKTHISGIG